LASSLSYFLELQGHSLQVKSPELGSNAVLVIDLAQEFKEQVAEDPLQGLTGDEQNPDFLTALQLIDHAASDTAIKGIYLVAKGNANGYANSDELRAALMKFKNKRKFIYAYGDYITQKAYGLVSVSDKVLLSSKRNV